MYKDKKCIHGGKCKCNVLFTKRQVENKNKDKNKKVTK